MTQPPKQSADTESYLRTVLQCFGNALIFLTRLPLPATVYDPELQKRSVVFFPLVGLVVGLVGAAVFQLTNLLWPETVAIVFALLAMILCTGGFHEDGLADTADGIGGGWSIDDKLRIMKDSRIGTYGSLALLLAMLLKYAALTSLSGSQIPGALVSAHVLARWSILPLLRYGDYIGDGTGNPFADAVSGKRLVIGTLSGWLIVMIAAPGNALILFLAATAMAVGSRWYFRRKLGGITGDSLGAANQLIEIAVYLVIAASGLR